MNTFGNNIFQMERTGRGRLAKDVPQGNNFGAWLRAKRLERNLTGEALAFAIGGGMTQGRISAYERGHKKPERETVVRIAEALSAEPREALEALMADTEGYATPDNIDMVILKRIQRLNDTDKEYVESLIDRLVRDSLP